MHPIDSERAARELARAILADVGLFDGATAEIAEGRALYQSRVIAPLHPLFDAELAEHQARHVAPQGEVAEGRVTPARNAAVANPTKRAKPIVVVVSLAVLALIGFLIWRAQRIAGDEVGTLPIPGALEREVNAGDRLSFTVDADVLFRGFSRNAKPEGCRIELTLAQDGRDIAHVACDPFTSGAGISIAGGTDYSVDDATGLRRMRNLGQRVACGFSVTVTGPVTIRAAGNLATCVPKTLSAVAHVYRARGP